jgi:hypothetical protein
MNHIEIFLALLAPLGTIAVYQWRLHGQMTKLLVEHEILVDFMCEKTGKRREDLPTRHNGVK